ncbi:MAG: ATP-binding cassette domain-containing protein [Treponema sp.]|nr:ATP-binding cassette domain-containing protein [Treponema sp.]
MDYNQLTKTALKIADSIDYSAPQTDEKNVLLRVRNLKQYFPVKGKKNLFVRANDGISMDIYEGETLGLVGESGCGKSTFGRTILQLYQQTYGKTIYFGRSLDSVAPVYLGKTVARLPALLNELVRQNEKTEALSVTLEAIKKQSDKTDKQLFSTMENYAQAKKLTEDEFLAIAQVLGGLMLSKDVEAVQMAYSEYEKVVRERNKLNARVDKNRLKLTNTNNRGKYEAAIADLEVQIAEKDQVIKQKYGEIEKLRNSMQGDPNFKTLEAFRDGGIDLARLRYKEIRALRKEMQIIFQDPYSSLNPRMTVGQIIGEGLLAQNFFTKTNENMFDHIKKVMKNCGLADYMIHRYPHQFSGGQRQRIGIARSLAVYPKFVVCDEPVSALDVSIQSQILNLLSDLKEKDKLTYLFISHDMSVIKYICDRIGVMYLGNIVELARTEDMFRQPRHPYTEALLKAIPTTDPDQSREEVILEGDIPSPIRPPTGCKFHTRCPYVTDICKELTPDLIEAVPGHFVACHHKLG